MAVGLVAVHYPKPEHTAEMVDRVRAAAQVLVGVAGCQEASCWQDTQGAVLTIGKWQSEDALRAGFGALTDADGDYEYDERESRPREIFRIVSV